MSSEPLFLGLDIGTSGVKAIVVNSSGSVVATAVSPLALDTPRPGWAEQHPDDWWRASLAAIRDACGENARHVAAIGISGQMHSSVFLDREGKVIRPALLWCDGRTTEECREITLKAGGEERLRDLTCNPALEGFTLPGRCTGGHRSAARCSSFQHDVDFHGWIAARIENLAGMDTCDLHDGLILLRRGDPPAPRTSAPLRSTVR